MSEYKTMQRQELLRFLNEHSEEAMTISDIYIRMVADSKYHNVPAQSTVYRLIKEMTDTGMVKRMSKGNSRHFVYQITPKESCKEHLHMKCSVCGNMYHLDEKTSRLIAENVLNNDDFEVGYDTVLTGKCVKCK